MFKFNDFTDWLTVLQSLVVVLKGVTSKFNWEDFSKYITSGRVISLNSNISNEVIISEILSNKLLINLGDKFKATFFTW